MRNPHFIGREELLARLRENLINGSSVVLQGLGGVGKTQLAIEYTQQYVDEYDVICWLDAAQPIHIADQIVELASAMGLPVDTNITMVVKVVVATFQQRDRWLLVFDNADNPRHLLPYLPDGGHVVVTSQRSGWSALAATIDVTLMSRAESLSLLTRRRPGIDMRVADEVAELLGDLPLAVEQAAAYMEQTAMPPEEYVRFLKNHRERLLELGFVLGHEHTVATVWKPSCRRVTEANPAAGELLRLCAFLGPEPIPFYLFAEQASLLPTALAEATADPVAFTNAIGVIVSYSLAYRTPREMTLHRLLAAATRKALSTEQHERYGSMVRGLLRGALPAVIRNKPEHWPRWGQLLPHVLAATGAFDPHSDRDNDNTSWLLERAALYIQIHAQPAEARPLLERALTINEAAHGERHPAVATSLHHLAGVLRDLGEVGQARRLLERALAINESAHGADHPSLVGGLNDLALVLRDLGEPDQARRHLTRALALSDGTNHQDRPEFATIIHNYARILWDQGEADRARRLLERALAINESAYGRDHPALVGGLNDLALVLRTLRDVDLARSLLERALAIAVNNYPLDHPTVQTIQAGLRDL